MSDSTSLGRLVRLTLRVQAYSRLLSHYHVSGVISKTEHIHCELEDLRSGSGCFESRGGIGETIDETTLKTASETQLEMEEGDTGHIPEGSPREAGQPHPWKSTMVW